MNDVWFPKDMYTINFLPRFPCASQTQECTLMQLQSTRLGVNTLLLPYFVHQSTKLRESPYRKNKVTGSESQALNQQKRFTINLPPKTNNHSNLSHMAHANSTSQIFMPIQPPLLHKKRDLVSALFLKLHHINFQT